MRLVLFKDLKNLSLMKGSKTIDLIALDALRIKYK